MASHERGQPPKPDLAWLGLRHRRSPGRPTWRRVRLGLACLALWGGGGGSVAPASGSWIDPDTLPEDLSKTFVGDEREFGLVFSDEFDRCDTYVQQQYACLLRRHCSETCVNDPIRRTLYRQ